MTFQHDLLRGKIALVTGGMTGIGAAIAAALAALGADVVAAGLGGPAPGETGAGLAVEPAVNPAVKQAELDVSSTDSVAALVDSFAVLDIVVNCAGVIRREAEHDIAVFEQVLNVNLTGTMRVCAAARPLLRASRGCIVNTASMLSYFGGGLVPAYSASKGGIAQLTKSLAIAYAADQIRVNAVAPGWIATPLTAQLQCDEGRAGPILARTPLGRWGRPDEVAQVAVFLCTPAASFMTAAIVPVDGGYLAA